MSTIPEKPIEEVAEVAAVEEEEKEEDTTLNNSDVVVRYKKAAQWANEVLTHVVSLVKAGAKVGELCLEGDKMINEKVKQLFKGKDKGIAFPTSVSVNSAVCHNSPSPGDDGFDQLIATNDLVHIDLGIQVDGYIAVVAHTVHVTEDGKLNPESKEANIIAAAHAALDAAVRNVRPGVSVYAVTEIIEKVAAAYNVHVVEGVLSHQMKRFIIDGSKAIACKDIAEQKLHDYDFAPMTVWGIDILFSTNGRKGYNLKERDAKCSIFKTTLDCKYRAKLQAAQEVHKEVEKKFGTFPFAVRNLEHKRARLGLNDLTKHEALAPFPVLYEKEGEAVAHFKSTVLITGKKIERVTGLAPQEGATAVAFADEKLAASAKMPFSLVPKKEKK